MGMIYTVSFTAVAVTAQQDLFEWVAPSDACVVVHWVRLSQSTEVGDAQEEGLSLLFKRGQTTSGSGGSSATPVPTEAGFAAAGGTYEVNNTTKATAGTIVTLHPENWNVRAQNDWLATPETRFVLSPGIRGTLELATTPADSITMSGVAYIEEFGG